jgi:glutamate/tyrosine decarboxylase-like PLP-dependent enzyme
VREEQHLRAAMAISAAYLQTSPTRDSYAYTPEASRRARAVEVWAALRSLGRTGVADMVERNCQQAKRFADGLQAAGFPILNDVVLNQVLVSFGDDATTQHVISEVQKDGTCWCGGTKWRGKAAMRISVSCWATTDEDVDKSLAAIVGIAKGANAQKARG